MQHIEDDRDNPTELDKDEFIMDMDLTIPENRFIPHSSIETYHWSEIHAPRFSDISLDIFNGEITLTQRVNFKGETPKVHPQKSAIIIYDSAFLQYKLLEVVAPLICNWKEELDNGWVNNPETGFDESVMPLEDLTIKLAKILVTAIASSIECHDGAIELCNDIGVSLPFSAKALLRSFKLAKAKEYKQLNEF